MQGINKPSIIKAHFKLINNLVTQSMVGCYISTTLAAAVVPILLDGFYWTDAEKSVVHEGLNSKAKYVVTNIDWGLN